MRGQLASLGRKNQRRRERRSGRRGKPARQDRRGTTSHPASQPVRKERMSGRRGQPASQDRRVRTSQPGQESQTRRLRRMLRRRTLLRNSQPTSQTPDDDDQEEGHLVLPVGNKTACPICKGLYQNAWTCRRHMMQQHGVTDKAVLKGVAEMRKTCHYCNR